jgi:hypothetical protein
MSLSVDLSEKLFHGSISIIDNPTHDFKEARSDTDFGKGFYLTNSKSDAKQLALDRGRHNHLSFGVVNEYHYEKTNAVLIHEFSEPSIEWLDFVLYNRSARIREFIDVLKCESIADNDIIIGPVANRTLSPEINRLEDSLESLIEPDVDDVRALKQIAAKNLRPFRLEYQACFKTKCSIENLRFVRNYNVTR